MEIKACVGCGILSDTHPFVAVMQPQDVPEGVDIVGTPGPQGFVASPCCQLCHVNPEHRVRPIKGHFFTRAQHATAVLQAGSNNIGGPRG